MPVVSITGDIDLENSPKLREFLKPKASQKTPSLLLDFAGVNYIDSSGLATLIEYFQAVQGFKGKLALASLSPRVKNVFEIVRLERRETKRSADARRLCGSCPRVAPERCP